MSKKPPPANDDGDPQEPRKRFWWIAFENALIPLRPIKFPGDEMSNELLRKKRADSEAANENK